MATPLQPAALPMLADGQPRCGGTPSRRADYGRDDRHAASWMPKAERRRSLDRCSTGRRLTERRWRPGNILVGQRSCRGPSGVGETDPSTALRIAFCRVVSRERWPGDSRGSRARHRWSYVTGGVRARRRTVLEDLRSTNIHTPATSSDECSDAPPAVRHPDYRRYGLAMAGPPRTRSQATSPPPGVARFDVWVGAQTMSAGQGRGQSRSRYKRATEGRGRTRWGQRFPLELSGHLRGAARLHPPWPVTREVDES